MLADYAQANGGKLTMVGGGWNTQQGAAAFAVCGFALVPPSLQGEQFNLRVALVDRDGQGVVLPGGAAPLALDTVAQTEPADEDNPQMRAIALVFNFSPIAMPDGQYVWSFAINGVSNSRWNLPFQRISAPD